MSNKIPFNLKRITVFQCREDVKPALKLLGLCDAKVVILESYVESSFVTTAFGLLLVEVEERVVS